MIKIAVLMFLCATLIKSIVKFTKGPLQHTCSDILEKFDKCWKFENCLYYQVTEQYTDYGCSICDENYELQTDENTAGYCLYNKNALKNCIYPARNSTGTPLCYLCEKNYILANDFTNCSPMTKECSKIPNCESYQYDSNGAIICQACKNNFTVSKQGSECIKGCSIDNCEKCVDNNGVHQCVFCKAGYIGVIDLANLNYDACLTCDEYQCENLTEEAKKCCLDQLSKCKK